MNQIEIVIILSFLYKNLNCIFNNKIINILKGCIHL
jgi:hypothetical protein